MTPEQLTLDEAITVSCGTVLNFGPSEDSDFVTTTGPISLRVVGELREGALPVKIEEDGKLSEEVFYYHQPVRINCQS